MSIKRAGIMTGGIESPGVNAVIRGLVTRLDHDGVSCVGIQDGWQGALEARWQPLGREVVRDILPSAGTMLGTSRANPRQRPGGMQDLIDRLGELDLDVLIVIGGEDTLSVAAELYQDHGFPIVGVPKSIDNELYGTDYTFGFDTAVQVATEAIDRLRASAESNRRIMIIETLGRFAGWTATHAGLAAGANFVLVPERPIDIDQLVGGIERNRARGGVYNIAICSQGAWIKDVPRGDREAIVETITDGARRRKIQQFIQFADLEGSDEFGHPKTQGFMCKVLSELIAERTDIETREMALGTLQRGGRPTAFDRILGTRYALKAAEMALAGSFGAMAALHSGSMVEVPLHEALGKIKYVDERLLALADALSD
jgi:6-phosphofructokinase